MEKKTFFKLCRNYALICFKKTNRGSDKLILPYNSSRI